MAKRILKFRAKRIEHNKLVYGMPLPSQFGCGYMLNIDAAMDADFYHSRYTMPTIESTPDINEDTIGQFTGLRDKNGDGDIEYQRKPIWHDLRKNPDDMPKDNKEVLVKYISYVGNNECNDVASYIFNQDEQCYEWKFRILGSCLKILAWMEIPEF